MGMFRDGYEDKIHSLEKENEQLNIFLRNNKYTEDLLRERLKKLTGCTNFGGIDGMDGACVECFYTNRALFDKCEKFKFDK